MRFCHKKPKHRPPKGTPKALLSLLTSAGSLTTQLSRQAGKPLMVQIMFEGFRPLTLIEWQAYRHLTGQMISKSKLAWVREVALSVDGAVWVFAKSFVIINELHGKMHRLRHLNNTPMGHILFSHHNTLPFVRQFACFDGQIARQSCYDWRGQWVFVEERFSGF